MGKTFKVKMGEDRLTTEEMEIEKEKELEYTTEPEDSTITFTYPTSTIVQENNTYDESDFQMVSELIEYCYKWKITIPNFARLFKLCDNQLTMTKKVLEKFIYYKLKSPNDLDIDHIQQLLYIVKTKKPSL